MTSLILTLDEARSRAAALVPRLLERAQACEDLRRCPGETIDELCQSGLMRMMQPRRFGGSELGMDALLEVMLELTRGCASSAWVYLNLASHAWNIGQFSLEAQEDVWTHDPKAVAATGLAFPCGKAHTAPGGFRVSGKWPFASGVDAASWMIVGATVERVEEAKRTASDPTERRFFLVPRGDFRSLDNWQAFGLAGTGSHDVEVRDAFVPEHRSLSAVAVAAGTDVPGAQLYDAPLFRVPTFAAFAFALGMVPLGIARAAVSDFIASTRQRAGTYTGARLAELSPIQMRIAEASASVDFFEQTLRHDLSEMLDLAERRTSASTEARLRWKRNVAFGVRLAKLAVDALMAASGAGGLATRHPLQRHFRDINAAAAHIALTWDVQAVLYGQNALELPLPAGALI